MFNLNRRVLLEILENLYIRYNRRDYVSPDPLQFLYNYDNFHDIEIVALLSASLAYGNVKMILKSIDKILNIINVPNEYVKSASLYKMNKDFYNFKHRFTKGNEIASLLFSIKNIYIRHGSMYNLFLKIFKQSNENITETIKIFFNNYFSDCSTLIPDPEKGSACKRIFLFLRWLVRKDKVDLGIWEHILPSVLIVPLDTHMLKIANLLKLTERKNNGFKTAKEITENFAKLNSYDPVKYDFVLTRFGIRKMSLDFLQ